MAKVLVTDSSLTAIADAIRVKTGTTTKYKPGEMAAAVTKLTDVSGTTATADDVLNGKTFYTADGTKTTGSHIGELTETTGDIIIESPDKWTCEITQVDNQTISANPKASVIQDGDGYSSGLTFEPTITPYVGYTPGAMRQKVDKTKRIITLTAGPAEEIAGMVENGWVSVQRDGSCLYDSNGARVTPQGKILVSEGTDNDLSGNNFNLNSSGYFYNNADLKGYKDNFLQKAGNYFLSGCTGLTEVDVGNMTQAGNYFLSGCTGLTKVDVGNMTQAGSYFLSGCTGLTEVDVGNMTQAGKYFLSGCTGLTKVDLINLEASSTYPLWEDVIVDLANLQSIRFGAKMTYMYATTNKKSFFTGCPKLEKIIIMSETPPNIASDGLASTNFISNVASSCKLYVPESAVDAYKADSNWGTMFGDNILPITDDVTL